MPGSGPQRRRTVRWRITITLREKADGAPAGSIDPHRCSWRRAHHPGCGRRVRRTRPGPRRSDTTVPGSVGTGPADAAGAIPGHCVDVAVGLPEMLACLGAARRARTSGGRCSNGNVPGPSFAVPGTAGAPARTAVPAAAATAAAVSRVSMGQYEPVCSRSGTMGAVASGLLRPAELVPALISALGG